MNNVAELLEKLEEKGSLRLPIGDDITKLMMDYIDNVLDEDDDSMYYYEEEGMMEFISEN